MKSESIGKLALALSKAQSKITGAIMDSQNPFFKSSYADLASVMDAIRIPFAENELAVSQIADEKDGKLILLTFLMHSSGEFLMSTYPVSSKDMNNPQAIGSGITYARRYALAAIAGVAQVDDDSESAMARPKIEEKKPLVNHAPTFQSDVEKGAEYVKSCKVVTDAQLKRLYAIQSKSKMSGDDIGKMIKMRFKKELSKELNMAEYDELCSVVLANTEV